MILDLRANQAGVALNSESGGYHRKAHKGVHVIPQYALSEIVAYIEVKLPRVKGKREKYENDRVLLR
jgi:hypothetical protein